MKNTHLIKATAVAAVASVLLCAAGCSDTSWSYKTDNVTLTNGNWIYYTYNAYNSAMEKLGESNEGFDASKADFSSLKIEDMSALDWIKKEAEKSCIAQMTLEKLVVDHKVEVEETAIKAMADQYDYYYQMGQSFYEELGVSSSTFAKAEARTQYLSDAVFKKVYGKDGAMAVSDEDLNKYFIENYTDYYYVSYPLTKKDDEGKDTAISDEDKDQAAANFAKYVKMINEEGKSKDDVDSAYKADFEVDTVPGTKSTVILENMGLSENLVKAIKEAEVGKATMKIVDDTYYLIYRGKIEDSVKRITEDTTAEDAPEDPLSRDSILYNMKKDDYETYLEGQQKALKYEKNEDCLSKYSVQRTIDIIKRQNG